MDSYGALHLWKIFLKAFSTNLTVLCTCPGKGAERRNICRIGLENQQCEVQRTVRMDCDELIYLGLGANGTTHITNGCYRLHPVEWSIGEVLEGFHGFLRGEGVELEWNGD